MRRFDVLRWLKYLAPVIVAGLLACSAARADVIVDDEGFGTDTGSEYMPGSVDPFFVVPGADYSNPDAVAMANYWFSIMSDPWNNYSLILELFGPEGAAALLAAETPSPLLDPPPDSDLGQTFTALSDTEAPEPVTTVLAAAGLFALIGWGLSPWSMGRGEASS